MKKVISALAALALVVSMSSCSQNEILGQNEGRTPINFRISTGKTTRAAQDVTEVNNMENKTITVFVKTKDTGDNIVAGSVTDIDGNPYSVFYFKTDASGANRGTFVNISDTDPTDLYMPVDGTKLVFAAFTNSDNTAVPENFVMDDEFDISIDDYENDPINELLWAVSGETDYSTSSVTLNFQHIVSQLMFFVDLNGNADIKQNIVITDFTVNVPTTGDWATSGYTGSFSSLGTAGAYTPTDVAYNADSTTTVGLTASGTPRKFASLFVLPTADLTGMSITVSYQILDAAGNTTPLASDTKTINFSTFGTSGITGWLTAKRYAYTFKPSVAGKTVTGLNWSFVISGDVWDDADNNDEVEPNTLP